MTNTEAARAARRRKQTVAGAVGLAAVLGGGAFLVTERITGDPDTVVRDTGALAPLAPSAAPQSPAASRSPAAPATSRTPATARPASPTPATSSPSPRTTSQRIRDARQAAAGSSSKVTRPLPPAAGVVDPSAVTVTNTGSPAAGATLRVVSARLDLTGYRELGWAADEGEAVGSARCTQNFRLSADAPVRERPTMLLCWRTSADRSVYTVAVKLDGRPSKTDTVAALDRQWSKLG